MPPKRFGCSHCDTKCTTKSKLEEHLKQHNLSANDTENKRGRKSHKCSTCSEVFTSVALLKRHKSDCKALPEPEISKKKGKNDKQSTPSVSRTVTSVNKHKKPLAEDDAFRTQMFTKVQSILDSNKNSEKVSNVATAATSNQSLYDVATSKLSTNGIHSMSLSLQNSLKNKTKTARKFAASSPSSKSVLRASPRTSPTKPPEESTDAFQESELPMKRTLKGLPDNQSSITQDITNILKSNTIIDLSILNENLPDSEMQEKEVKDNDVPVKKRRGRKKNLSVKFEPESPEKNETNVTVGKRKKSESDQSKEYCEIQNLKNKCSSALNSQDDNQEFNIEKYQDGNNNVEIKNVVEEKFFLEEHTSEFNNSQLKQFVCSLCSRSFSRKYHLDRHLKMSPCSGMPPPLFSCQVCNRVYTRKDNLRGHLRTHTGEFYRSKNYKCEYCNKAFHGQSLLTIHERKHTGEKPFPCDFCPKRFPSVAARTKHRRTHTGEKPFSCPDCGQRFSLKGTLNRHLRVHTGVRPHKCMYCGKEFIQIGGLKAHLFYHTGENGFKCEDCGKVFNRKARLEMHKLYVHVKLRTFTCDSCPKAFTRKEDLNRHAILHTGEKPFKCPACDKSFAIKPSLKLHLLTHTKEEPRSCHECGRAFIRKDCLLRHMRKRHRDLLDKILLDENDEKFSTESHSVNSRMLNEEDLCENIHELLSLLVEESTLVSFGWPDKPVDEVLESVIRRCGHTPVDAEQYSYLDRMRENAKLLFTVVIDDCAVKTLLNNQTVDEVILHVLRLAKT